MTKRFHYIHHQNSDINPLNNQSRKKITMYLHNHSSESPKNQSFLETLIKISLDKFIFGIKDAVFDPELLFLGHNLAFFRFVRVDSFLLLK